MQVNGITFPIESGPFTLGGNSISLNGTVTNASAATQTIAMSITLVGGAATFSSTNGNLSITGNIASAGAVGIQKTGSGAVILSGNNTYAGGTTVTGGKLIVTSVSALPAGGDLTIGSAAYFAPAPVVGVAPALDAPTATAPVSAAAQSSAPSAAAQSSAPSAAATTNVNATKPSTIAAALAAPQSTKPISPRMAAAFAISQQSGGLQWKGGGVPDPTVVDFLMVGWQ
jgi:autotransporter-associated beta strand protein